MTRRTRSTVLQAGDADNFARFWAIYPNRVAKKEAQHAWGQILPRGILIEQILLQLEAQIRAREVKLARREWVAEWPNPATWLRQERWTDEVARIRLSMPQTHVQKTQEVKRLIADGLSPEHARRLVYGS